MYKWRKAVLALMVFGSLLAAGCQGDELGTGAVVGNEPKVLMTEQTNMLTLNQDEQKLYDSFKEKYDFEVLKDADPIMVAKLYVHAVITQDAETQYELTMHAPEAVPVSKEQFVSEVRQNNGKTAKAFKDMFSGVQTVKFVEVDRGSGYIEFLMNGEESGQLLMGRDERGIWKMKEMPHQ
ncbi:hypothetical protein [Staphylospora marina]|uniref:hypothetical protein n=1 Tax=Staphylospora marina TaxID=2490858 RepID=UPI000F5BC900|nr:hypothetical protein [Staphylospora marina]